MFKLDHEERSFDDNSWHTNAYYHAAHAFQKVSGKKHRHPLDKCPYCFMESRHSREFVESGLPLGKINPLTSSSITRIMVFVGNNHVMCDYLKSALDIHVCRELSDRGVIPSPRNIVSEVSQALDRAKTNDRVLVVIDPRTSFDLNTVLDHINPKSMVWFVCNNKIDMPYTRTGTELTEQASKYKDYINLNVIQGPIEWLECLKERKGRVTVKYLLDKGFTWAGSTNIRPTRVHFSF